MARQPTDGPEDSTREQLAELKRDMTRMEEMVRELVGANAIENVLINGFSKLSTTLSAQLQPLENLTPQRTLMKKPEIKKLRRVREELARQNWAGTITLDEPKDTGQAASRTAL